MNLATMLLCDAYENDFEAAAVITNDSDLALPIQLVRRDMGKPAIILAPNNHPAVQLKQAGTFIRHLRSSWLGASQFPSVLYDRNGPITNPAGW